MCSQCSQTVLVLRQVGRKGWIWAHIILILVTCPSWQLLLYMLMKTSSKNLWHVALYITNHSEADLAYLRDVVWMCLAWIGQISLESSEAATNNSNEVIKIIKNWLYVQRLFTLNLDPQYLQCQVLKESLINPRPAPLPSTCVICWFDVDLNLLLGLKAVFLKLSCAPEWSGRLVNNTRCWAHPLSDAVGPGSGVWLWASSQLLLMRVLCRPLRASSVLRLF